jgi:Flp pilus assembly protein TadD
VRLKRRVLACAIAACGLASCRDAPAPASSTSAAPTYTGDIAPILDAKCAGCHRPGQGAPFSLVSYQDAQQRARAIADVTSAREMPPWLPEPNDPPFIGERRLSDAEIAMLRRWAESGATEGDPRLRPSAPAQGSEWQAGTPDLVLRPAKAFQLEPQSSAPGNDVFRNIVIRTSLPADRFVRAVEFSPGTASIHHAVLHLDPTSASRQLDGRDGQPGFDGMGGPGTEEPDGHFVGWAPGRGPIVSAEGRPWRLARNTDVVLELHLIPGDAPKTIQPTVALFFDTAPAQEAPVMMKMGDVAIDIPPGRSDYAIADRYLLPVDVKVLSLYPHAHYLGREMEVLATPPGGAARTLLHIKQWSFHWQQDYRYMSPVTLPKGTAIDMRFTYDNSDGNPENPHHPPLRVTSGPRSTDEMGNLLLQVVPTSATDRSRLMQSLLEHAVEVNPRSARARNELGGALLKAGRTPDAVRHFKRATELSPDDPYLLFNLGKALAAAGAGTDAARAFQQALTLNPDFAEAHDELGVLLFAAGRLDDAIAHLRKAVDLAPGSAVAHSDLGGALAQAGRRDEALQHIRRALALDPGHAAARENLARLTRGRRP